MKLLQAVFILLFAVVLTHAQKPDLIVSQDGKGSAKTIQEAIDKVPDNNRKRFVIFIKKGVYQRTNSHSCNKRLYFIYRGIAENTKLTFNLSNKDAGRRQQVTASYRWGTSFTRKISRLKNSFGQELTSRRGSDGS